MGFGHGDYELKRDDFLCFHLRFKNVSYGAKQKSRRQFTILLHKFYVFREQSLLQRFICFPHAVIVYEDDSVFHVLFLCVIVFLQ